MFLGCVYNSVCVCSNCCRLCPDHKLTAEEIKIKLGLSPTKKPSSLPGFSPSASPNGNSRSKRRKKTNPMKCFSVPSATPTSTDSSHSFTIAPTSSSLNVPNSTQHSSITVTTPALTTPIVATPPVVTPSSKTKKKKPSYISLIDEEKIGSLHDQSKRVEQESAVNLDSSLTATSVSNSTIFSIRGDDPVSSPVSSSVTTPFEELMETVIEPHPQDTSDSPPIIKGITHASLKMELADLNKREDSVVSQIVIHVLLFSMFWCFW